MQSPTSIRAHAFSSGNSDSIDEDKESENEDIESHDEDESSSEDDAALVDVKVCSTCSDQSTSDGNCRECISNTAPLHWLVTGLKR